MSPAGRARRREYFGRRGGDLGDGNNRISSLGTGCFLPLPPPEGDILRLTPGMSVFFKILLYHATS